VERQGQKIILIGNKGEMLKKIGTTARLRLEELVQRKVFLSLFVAVKPNWREDPSFLDTVDWRTMLGSESKAEEKS
jgi:GTP-binding protein Era